MTNPSLAVPDALQPLLDLTKAIAKVGLPQRTIDIVRLRVSQINGRDMDKSQDQDAQLLAAVASFHDAPGFSDAERAALALAECATRLSDRDGQDPVPDEVWQDAARHYSEQELGALIMQIGLVNLWNRVNVATQEVAGSVRQTALRS
ncbi:MAG TPA: carboxymuconolactone decarboxylase family protein [Trebonia sp.]|jgi:alkylhydroperoxidase family enzyme|nr:carboxymuconolactone decarboxylase family protein [Trebonia sp.]